MRSSCATCAGRAAGGSLASWSACTRRSGAWRSGSPGTRQTQPISARFTSHTVPPGTHTFVFEHEGFQAVVLEVIATHESPAGDLEVIFEDGIRAEGVLRNLEGEPIPSTAITWKHVEELELRAAHRSTSTDAEGRFELAGLRPGRHVISAAEVEPEGHAVLTQALFQEVEVVIDLPVALRLKVEGPDGQPVEGARVGFRQIVKTQGGTRHRHWSSTTGKGGWCLLAGPERRGRLEIAAHTESLRAEASFDFAAIAAPITLRLESKGRLSGRVIAATGESVSEAILIIHSRAPDSGWLAGPQVVDEAGRFELEVFPGPVKLHAKHGLHGVAALDLVLGPGEERVLAPLVLDPGRAIRGRVVDGQGEPVENLAVAIRGERPVETMAPLASRGLVTDADGRFAALAEEGVYAIHLRPDIEPESPPAAWARPGEPPVILRLGSGRSGGR
jgi:hypothetical protein